MKPKTNPRCPEGRLRVKDGFVSIEFERIDFLDAVVLNRTRFIQTMSEIVYIMDDVIRVLTKQLQQTDSDRSFYHCTSSS